MLFCSFSKGLSTLRAVYMRESHGNHFFVIKYHVGIAIFNTYYNSFKWIRNIFLSLPPKEG